MYSSNFVAKFTRSQFIFQSMNLILSNFLNLQNEVDGNRRIDFVKLGSGKVLGQEVEGCNQFQANPFMMWISTCRYCFCYCDAPGPNSDRHFSLRNVVSNVTDNK